MTIAQDNETIIRERAYYLWEASGRPDGEADRYWHKAVDEIIAPTMTTPEPASKKTAPTEKTTASKTSRAAKSSSSLGRKARLKKALAK